MWYKIQKIYVGSNQVRPKWSSSTIYDFTTDDICTFVTRQNSYTWYWWTSWSWYYSYVQSSSYYRTNTTWKLPDTAYIWTLNMLKIEIDVPNRYSWGGIAYNSTNNYAYGFGLGAFNTNTQDRMTKPDNSYYTYAYTAWVQTLVIDLVNAQMYVEWNTATPISLTATEVTNIRNSRTDKTMVLDVVANIPNSSWARTYFRKLEVFTE